MIKYYLHSYINEYIATSSKCLPRNSRGKDSWLWHCCNAQNFLKNFSWLTKEQSYWAEAKELGLKIHWDFKMWFHMPSGQFSPVPQPCLTVCNPMDCSTPGFPVCHRLPNPTQIHVHHIGDATQPSHPLSPPSPPLFNLSQHQGLFQWVSYSHQVAKVLEFQLQHQSFQWTVRTDFL